MVKTCQNGIKRDWRKFRFKQVFVSAGTISVIIVLFSFTRQHESFPFKVEFRFRQVLFTQKYIFIKRLKDKNGKKISVFEQIKQIMCSVELKHFAAAWVGMVELALLHHFKKQNLEFSEGVTF